MKSRAFMTYRTNIERVTHASDSGGGYTDEWATNASNVHCHAWAPNLSTISQLVGASERPEVVNSRLVQMPRDTDVRVGDRLTSILDRRDRVMLAGPFIIDGITERIDHLLLNVRYVA